MLSPQQVRVAVYDVLGREVIVLLDERLAPGRRELVFDASALAPGTYVLRASSGRAVRTAEVSVVR